MIKLSEPVEFDAADGEPVDLIFGMLVPKDLDESHVEEIKGIARVLGEEGLRARLRESKTSNELYETLLEGSQLAGPATVRAAQGR